MQFRRMACRLLALPGRLYRLQNEIRELRQQVIEQKLLAGRTLSQFNASREIACLNDAEFKVFSQYGDDGIIQYLVRKIRVSSEVFVEFGVQSYDEANTRFLLLNDNWRGLVMDASSDWMEALQKSWLCRTYDLQARASFVTRDNINGLIADAGIAGRIGLLSIDIDGNDYWVWEAINVVTPDIVVIEYNSVFGPEMAWTVPYRPDFQRSLYHHSNLCYGASLAALCDLGERKGYAFVGCNRHGNNAYFVRRDVLGDLRALDAVTGYVASNFSEGRDEEGHWTFSKGTSRLTAIAGAEVWNTRTGRVEPIRLEATGREES